MNIHRISEDTPQDPHDPRPAWTSPMQNHEGHGYGPSSEERERRHSHPMWNGGVMSTALPEMNHLEAWDLARLLRVLESCEDAPEGDRALASRYRQNIEYRLSDKMPRDLQRGVWKHPWRSE